MCSSVTEKKREMCTCRSLFSMYCSWRVMVTGMFLASFYPLSRYVYSFYLRFLPLFCHYRYIISLDPRKLTNQCCLNRAIVAKENAKKCGALLLFYFLAFFFIAVFDWARCSVTTQKILHMGPFGWKTNDLMQNAQILNMRFQPIRIPIAMAFFIF